jgi:hypothetical protein
LSSTRRNRARAKLHGWQWEQGRRNRPSSYGQLPGQAKELVKMTQTEVIAREMAAKSDEVKARLLDPDKAPPEVGLTESSPSQAGPAGTGTAETGTAETGTAGADMDRPPTASQGPGIADAVVTATWAWPAIAAFIVPGVVFAILMLV